MISVIVPVYNVKDHIEKCVGSVLAQSEADFELLLIDDGSTDGSGAVCDDAAGKDGRIRVIHQQNAGLGGARNTGIENARGEWLFFLDSDDWIEPDILEKARALGEKTGAEIVMFGYRSVDENGNELARFTEELPKEVPLTLEKCPELLLTAPSACNKLYRAELFRRTGVRYPSKVWYEDMRTTPKLLASAGAAAVTDAIGYNYLQRSGSITQNANADRNVEIIYAFDDLLSWYRERGLFDKYRDELSYLTVFHVYLTASVRVLRIDKKHPLLGKFRRYLTENFPDWEKGPHMGKLGGKRSLLIKLLDLRLYGLIGIMFKIKGQ